MLGVREFTSEEQFNPKVQVIIQTVERISQQEGIKTPEIGIYTSHDVNAFATGATKNSSLVAVSTELLQQMSEKEIEGVIGHEMAHIVNGDMVTLTLIQGVVNTFVYILSEALSRLVSQVLDKEYGFLFRLLSSIVFQILFGVLASIFVNYVSRKREYAADALSAKLLGKEPMIAALKKLDVLHGMQREERDPKMAPFMITDEKEKDGLFSTHPTLKNRIIALEQSY